ncbi:hypothetical protein Calkro_2483 [Caldicellulosiruptor kronotskyensis 2002]|uniref:Uncharacterized protein n=1 Tax=Caldicellulosiruptor kronotskyensis (strain DSM 18902 / VKM B-2412 / 2002) TaxID=632348 RepID=E4SHR9_CALK2|nr:hypothetical protein [Caldicellulosiruptor kronotskyensis]ADQ47294.1 hypothetical protein Calkro_2483 [Caldicellulosiruptor kronotskyensis 2002]
MSDIKNIQEDIKHEVAIDIVMGVIGELTNIKIKIEDLSFDNETKERKIQKIEKILEILWKERDLIYRGDKDAIERALTAYALLYWLIDEEKIINSKTF